MVFGFGKMKARCMTPTPPGPASPATAETTENASPSPVPQLTKVETTELEAARALQIEQHRPLGLLDTVQTMFMWQESPAERVDKNRALGLVPPALPRLPPPPLPEEPKPKSDAEGV